MISLKPVFLVLGVSLLILAASMVVPIIADLYADHPDWKVFAVWMGLTAFVGGGITLTNYEKNFELDTKQAFFTTVLSWLIVTAFAAMPFKFSEVDLNTHDAFFEAMSGLTTTGATVIENLETIPPGILMWRATLQWIGGIAILVMALLVLPFLRVGGMQIFQTQGVTTERTRPRLVEQTTGIIIVYIALSFLCILAYGLSGFDSFDSIAYAMTTVSTGGFATRDNTFIGITATAPQITAIIFMLLGGMPFILFLKAMKGKAYGLFTDSQTKAYIGLFIMASLILSAWLGFEKNLAPNEKPLLVGTFSAISMITGTGYANIDFGAWSGFVMCFLLFLMVIGGCTGSTTCGIKIFRFQILYAVAVTQIKKLLHPSGVFIPRYQNKPLRDDAIISVIGFFFVFALTFVFGVMAVSLTEVELITSVSAVIACMSNVGPGFADVGPTTTYASLPEAAKWVLTICMFLGRLEFYTALVLLSPYFWKN